MALTIGKRIQQLRKQHNFSQQDLALKIGISRQTIGKWEQDLSLPDIEMLMKMAEVFNVPVTNLMGVETEANSLSEVYNQIKSVQNNLEKANKTKNIFQWFLIVVCVTSLGLMVSMKQQLDKQASYYQETNEPDEKYLIENVMNIYRQVDSPKESYTYIEEITMNHSSVDLAKWTTQIHYEISLKEFMANTQLEIQFVDDVQGIDVSYSLQKKSNGHFVLDKTIPLGNYSQVKLIIKENDTYKIESLNNGRNFCYLDAEIVNHIDISMPKDEYGKVMLQNIEYRTSFEEDLPFEGTFIFKIHNETEKNISNTFGFDITKDCNISLIQDLPIGEPIYISMTYIIRKDKTILTTGTLGLPSDELQYSYFVIDSVITDVKIV